MQEALPRSIIFVVENLTRPGGIPTAVTAVGSEFERLNIPVSYVVLDHVDDEFERRFNVFQPRRLRRFTTEMDGYELSKWYLRAPRRAITPLWRAGVKVAMKRFMARMGDGGLLIGATPRALQFAQGAAPRSAVRVLQMHGSFKSCGVDFQAQVLSQLPNVDFVQVLDSESRDQLAKGAECFVIPNPSPPIQVGSPEKRVVYLGRLSEEKQIPHIVEAFRRAGRRDWSLHIHGSGPERRKLQALVTNEPNIFLEGLTDNPTAVLQTAGILALASKFEGYPMVVLEAASCGVPTVSYDCPGGIREAVGEGGLLVELGDVDQLAEALRRVMDDGSLRAELSVAALRNAAATSGAVVVEQWIAAYREALRRRAVDGAA